MVSLKVLFKMGDVKVYLQADGNDPLETEELMIQERREIIARTNV